MTALQELRSPDQVAALRGLSISEVLGTGGGNGGKKGDNGGNGGDVAPVTPENADASEQAPAEDVAEAKA
jgi:hypothetical protein